MAGIEISKLAAVPAAILTDQFPVVQAAATKKETLQQILTLFQANLPFLLLAGGTMTGPLLLYSDTPVADREAASKAYVDAVAQGLVIKEICRVGTTAALTATYNNGASGVGATLTNSGTQAALVLDTIALAVNNRVVVKDQVATLQNGIYTVTDVGSVSTNWVLTRATDYDEPSDIQPGDLALITEGSINENSSWVETVTVTIIGTDPIIFFPFFLPSDYLKAINNLSDIDSASAALVNLGLGTPTGTGNVVLNNTPTLITPELGAATADSISFNTNIGIIGTATNDLAATGSVGALFSTVVPHSSSIPITHNTDTNIASIVLDPGDYDVWGNISFDASGTDLNTVVGWVSSTSALLPDFSLRTEFTNTLSKFADTGICVPMRPFQLASTTTIYLSAEVGFTAGSVTACGAIYARRRR